MALRFAFLVVWLCSLPTHAFAQQQADSARLEEARLEFRLATLDYDAGRFESALHRFERSYEITQAPELLYNIATVYDRMRRDREALVAYERYLAAIPNSADRANIEARIAVLNASLEREAQARHAGLEVPSETAPREVAEAQTIAAAESPKPVPAPPPDPGAGPWVLMIGGGAFLVAGAVLVALSAVDSDAVANATRWPDVAAAYDRVPIFSGVGFAALGVGAAALVTGIIWQIVGSSGPEESPVEVGFGFGTLRVRGAF